MFGNDNDDDDHHSIIRDVASSLVVVGGAGRVGAIHVPHRGLAYTRHYYTDQESRTLWKLLDVFHHGTFLVA